MKTNTDQKSPSKFALPRVGWAAFVLPALCASIQLLQAQASPVGTWDCLISGKNAGIARLTFNGNNTVTGVHVTYPVGASSASGSLRNPSGTGEDRTTSTNAASGSSTNLFFGGADLAGQWGFDSRGRVMGFLAATSGLVGGGGITNTISFLATVRPGSRLTLNAQGSLKSSVYRGVPYAPVTDISGTYFGTKTKNGVSEFETFTLAPDMLNEFNLTGSGPGYTNRGGALLSRQNQVALIIGQPDGSNVVQKLTVVSGSINTTRGTMKLKGFDGSGAVRYSATSQP